jgi:hypothetical protein
MHDERRKERRYEVDLDVQAETEGESLDLHAADVSLGGASLTGEHLDRLRVGQRFSLDLPMPGRGPVRTEAEVRWASTGRVGVRFDSQSRDALLELIESVDAANARVPD